MPCPPPPLQLHSWDVDLMPSGARYRCRPGVSGLKVQTHAAACGVKVQSSLFRMGLAACPGRVCRDNFRDK